MRCVMSKGCDEKRVMSKMRQKSHTECTARNDCHANFVHGLQLEIIFFISHEQYFHV